MKYKLLEQLNYGQIIWKVTNVEGYKATKTYSQHTLSTQTIASTMTAFQPCILPCNLRPFIFFFFEK